MHHTVRAFIYVRKEDREKEKENRDRVVVVVVVATATAAVAAVATLLLLLVFVYNLFYKSFNLCVCEGGWVCIFGFDFKLDDV